MTSKEVSTKEKLHNDYHFHKEVIFKTSLTSQIFEILPPAWGSENIENALKHEIFKMMVES